MTIASACVVRARRLPENDSHTTASSFPTWLNPEPLDRDLIESKLRKFCSFIYTLAGLRKFLCFFAYIGVIRFNLSDNSRMSGWSADGRLRRCLMYSSKAKTNSSISQFGFFDLLLTRYRPPNIEPFSQLIRLHPSTGIPIPFRHPSPNRSVPDVAAHLASYFGRTCSSKTPFEFWNCSLLATLMMMPKAAVNEYDLFPRGKDQIGRPGQITSM